MSQPKPKPEAITLNRNELLRDLTVLAAACEGAVTIPVLGLILLEAANGELQLTATDLDVSLQKGIECKGNTRLAGAVKKELLLSAVGAVRGDIVSIASDENHIYVSGEGARFKFLYVSREHFPSIKHADAYSAEIPARALSKAITMCSFAAQKKDESKNFGLTGLRLESEPSFALTATQGFCMASRQLEGGGKIAETIPNKAANILAMIGDKSEEAISVGTDDNSVYFAVDGYRLSARKLSKPFPKWREVFNGASLDNRIEFDRAEALRALRGLSEVSELGENKSRLIKMVLSDGLLRFQGTGRDKGEGIGELECDYKGESTFFNIAGQYLEQALARLDSRIVFLMRDNLTPVKFTNSEGTFEVVINPMRPEAY